MQLTAKLTLRLPIQTCAGKSGEWKKQDIIVEIDGKYPRKVCISIWNDKIDLSAIPIGRNIKVDFDAESREYNEPWYTDLRAWQISMDGKVILGDPKPGDDDYRSKSIKDVAEIKALLNFSINKKSSETTLNTSKDSDSPDDIIKGFDDTEYTE